jgi:serine/threonine protein kinase
MPVLTVPVLLDVLHGPGYAYGQGVMDRGIKPANIILTSSGQVKIADFGIGCPPECGQPHTFQCDGWQRRTMWWRNRWRVIRWIGVRICSLSV